MRHKGKACEIAGKREVPGQSSGCARGTGPNRAHAERAFRSEPEGFVKLTPPYSLLQ